MKDKLELTQEEINKVMTKAKRQLDSTNFFGPFGHNVVSLVLRGVASEIGTKYANELIDIYDLEDELQIYKVKE